MKLHQCDAEQMSQAIWIFPLFFQEIDLFESLCLLFYGLTLVNCGRIIS